MKRASLNHSFRLVWSKRCGGLMAVAETTRGRGKGAAIGLSTALLMSGLPLVGQAALPTGGTVEAGTGSISQSGNAMTINQGSDKLAINWNSFSIGAGNSVTFNQPSSSSVALNRVLGSEISVIQGALNANGQVFLVNPNGVLFSPTAQVNVGGIVASTLNITTSDFMAGNYRFEGNSSNAIVNQGNIQAAAGGSIALIAAKIINSGSLTANGGNVLLGAGSRVTLDLGGPVKLDVEEAAIDALIEQGGAIRADGGRIYLTAKAAGDLARTVINHTGITEARTLSTGEHGEIVLLGDMDNDRIQVAGTLDASAPEGANGGFIETSAAQVVIGADLRVTTHASQGTTGTWLIDPNDYRVAASGGDITGAQLSSSLSSTNVTIRSIDGGDASGNGDIFVNDRVTWSSGNTLTLQAQRNIEINSTIDASQGAGGKLALEYGQASVAAGNTATYTIKAPVSLQNGQNFSTKLGSDGAAIDYTVVNSQAALQGMTLTGNYALGSSLTFSGNWTPIGSSWNDCFTMFCGNFDGLGNTIGNLNIAPTSYSGDGIGFFAATEGATIQNLNFHHANLDFTASGLPSNMAVGTLIGWQVGGTVVRNVHITNSTVSDDGKGLYVGGLVGYLDSYGGVRPSVISHSSANVDLNSGGNYVGGLVGLIEGAQVLQSYASGSVTTIGSFIDLGGLAGFNGGTIADSYSIATVTVEGNPTQVRVGGLVGTNNHNGIIEHTYATGPVSSANGSSFTRIGGLVGDNQNADAGSNYGITNSYWDADSTGQTAALGNGSGAVGELRSITATINAYNQASYTGFDFNNTWWMADGATRPFLRNEWRQHISNAHQLQLMAMDLSADYSLTSAIDMAPSLTSHSEMWRCFAADCTNFQGSWSAVGRSGQAFGGSLDGGSHSISGLTINNSTADYQGLFGYISNASLANLNLTNVNIQARDWIGALVGRADNSQIDETHLLSGQVTSTNDGSTQGGSSRTGGLVGLLLGASQLSDSSSAATVQGYNRVGGLVGETVNNSGSVIVSNSTASGSVTGNERVGGLIGYANLGSQISHSHASSAASGSMSVGGLIGYATGSSTSIHTTYASGSVTATDSSGDGTGASDSGGLIGSLLGGASIERSWASGSVTGSGRNIGGLVGYMGGTSTIETSFATGNVQIHNSTQGEAGGLVGGVQANSTGHVQNSFASGSVTATDTAGFGTGVGGLIGRIRSAGSGFSVINSYATGQVNAPSGRNVGGLIGMANDAVVTSSYWDTQSSGLNNSAGGEGRNTAELRQFSLFNGAGWDIEKDSGLGSIYPRLSWRQNQLSGHYSAVWVIGSDVSVSPPPTDNNRPLSPPILGATSAAQSPLTLPDSGGFAGISPNLLGAGGPDASVGLEFVEVGADGLPLQPNTNARRPSGAMQVLVVNGGIRTDASAQANTDEEDI